MTGSAPVRVVVVEDSLTQRAHLDSALQADGDIFVIGEAVGATEAIEVIGRLRPDVVTLDLQIPDGGGQHVIDEVMWRTPTPILVLSATVSSRESEPAVVALMAGAVEAVPKPTQWTDKDEIDVRRTVRVLRDVTVVRRRARKEHRPQRSEARGNARNLSSNQQVVGIAASTGGPAALAAVLSGLDRLGAPVLVVQHLHPGFMDGFVQWMDRASAVPVRLAESGDHLEQGTVTIGPGETHLRLGADRQIVLDPEPVTTHRPSADEMFSSIAEHAGADGIGVVLTGMGDDGAAGLLALRQAGGVTIAQDEASCAVFGMPQAAQRLGAVDEMLPLNEIADAILRAERGVRS
jgi:two-component system chemotaxis response regulator CheB